MSVLAEGLSHPEGPALLPDGRIVFVETYLSRISMWDPATGVSSYADVGGGPNACAVGDDGVYVTQTGGSAGPWQLPERSPAGIQKVSWDGRVELLSTSADGVPLLAPNDLAFGPDGRLYFTDPGDYDLDRPVDGRVCVMEADGTTRVLVHTGPTFPNGILVEPDGSVVWDESHARTVHRLRPGGAVELLATLAPDRIPDGLKRAADGRLFVTGGPSGGLDVLAPDGELVGFVATGGDPLNCVFVGEDLYVTDYGALEPSAENGYAPAGGRLLRVPVGVTGEPQPTGAIRSGGD